jgi:5-methylcytosine-specific restriction endonuclease McrA
MPYKDKNKQRESSRESAERRREKDREIIYSLLGDKCCKCGFDNPLALQIDHIVPILRQVAYNSGDAGNTLRRNIASGRLDYKDFQMLCANCHAIKTQTERKKRALIAQLNRVIGF